MAGRGLGTLTLDLVARTGGFTGPLDQAGRVAEKRMREIERRAKQFGAAIGVALTAAATAIAVGIKGAIDQADALNDLNQRLGISAEALSGWAYAAKQSGTDIDALAVGMKRLSKNMAEALDPKSSQAKLFAALDIKPLDEATGKLKTLEQILPQIADKFKGLNDETLEAALAQEIFGKSGADLLEFLNLGSQGIEDMRSKLRELGGELSQETLTAADQFNDRLNDLKTASNGMYTALAADLLPELNRLVEQMIEAAKEGSQFRQNFDSAVTVLEYFGEMAGVVADTVRGLTSAVVGLYNAADILSKLNPGRALGEWVGGLMGGGNAGDSMAENWREVKTAAAQTAEAFGLVDTKAKAAAATVAGFGRGIRGGGGKGFGSSKPGGTPPDSRALYDLLNGGDDPKKTKKGGKSDAEREAEQLEAAYKRMNAQMSEQIALFGQTSEVAKVRYDLENGELAKLSAAQKEELLLKAEKLDLLAAEKVARDQQIRLEEEEIRAAEDHRESVKQLLDDIAFETTLIGLNNNERERMIALRSLNGKATAEEAAQIESAMLALQASRDANAELTSVMDEFRGNFADTVTDVLTGAKSIGDAFKDLADQVAEQISRILANQLTESLFGAAGTTGGGSGGNWLSSLFSIFLPHHASGTNFAPGGPSVVGEHGPEIVNLPRGSQVIPNHRLGQMGGGVTQNFYGPTTREVVQYAANRQARELALSRRG